jgi:lipopolysaccharide/colanic/teichoic acid biosynthesis glycosyltransferase
MLKRLFDLFVVFLSLPISFPLFVMVTVVLFFANGGSVFFTQTRVGKGNRLFKILKFKSMNDKRDADGNLLPDSERLTLVGSIVRKTSLDELPQLLNVLKGEMSLVGPRPLLTEYIPLYSAEQARRHNVRPGITGWAQVNGRNAISWKEKFELDVWYVDHQSFLLDLKILYRTVKKVFVSEGISADGSVTIEKFKGN